MVRKLDLLQEIVSNLIVAQQAPFRVLNGTAEMTAWIAKQGIVFGGAFTREGIVHGFNEAGKEGILDMVCLLRGEKRLYLDAMSQQKFSELIIRLIKNDFVPQQTVTPDDVKHFENALAISVQHAIADHTFFIPCLIIPDEAEDFSIGAISFCHINNFDLEKYTRHADLSKTGLIEVNRFIKRRAANWLATVNTVNVDTELGREKANLALDVAITGLQLIFHVDEARYMARGNGRSLAAHDAGFYLKNASLVTETSQSNLPGLSLSAAYFEKMLTDARGLMDSVGRRVDGFLKETEVIFPRLSLAWCDAAFWYHEGIAEPLDTVAITKLEASVEILCCAESSKKSNSRFKDAFSAFLGLDENQIVSNGVTVKELSKLFVSTRSRVLHGTFSTIQRNNKEIADRAIRPVLEWVVKLCLYKFTMYLDQYDKAPDAEDKIDPFLKWIKQDAIPALVQQP